MMKKLLLVMAILVMEQSYAQVDESKYDFEGIFHNGFAIVKKKGKQGFINKKKEEVIPLKYDDVYFF